MKTIHAIPLMILVGIGTLVAIVALVDPQEVKQSRESRFIEQFTEMYPGYRANGVSCLYSITTECNGSFEKDGAIVHAKANCGEPMMPCQNWSVTNMTPVKIQKEDVGENRRF